MSPSPSVFDLSLELLVIALRINAGITWIMVGLMENKLLVNGGDMISVVNPSSTIPRCLDIVDDSGSNR